MKVTRTFTFIISRNFGHPLTWNVEAWRVYAGGGAAGFVLLAMAALSMMYLLLQPQMEEMERSIQELQRERDTLRDQIHAADRDAFSGKERLWAEAGREQQATPTAAFSGRGFFDDDRYIPPLRLDNFRARVDRRSVEVAFRIVSQGRPGRLRGGFLFAIFENQDKSPTAYAASPKVDVNDKGFPLLYKSGIRFSRVRTAQTYRRRVSRSAGEGYYTHATVYLFSLRGGLLAKERYALARDLFVAGN